MLAVLLFACKEKAPASTEKPADDSASLESTPTDSIPTYPSTRSIGPDGGIIGLPNGISLRSLLEPLQKKPSLPSPK
jgi:hypothetical protein